MRRLLKSAVGVTIVLGVLAMANVAGAITGGTLTPNTLSATGQPITVDFSGKDTAPATATNTVAVQQCKFNDTKVGFDPFVDCSFLSLQSFNTGPIASGTVNYTGAFVGIDPDNSEYSFCAPDSGVPDFQSGFLRIADNSSDQSDDFFVAFNCSVPEIPEVPYPALMIVASAALIGGTVALRARSRRSTALA